MDDNFSRADQRKKKALEILERLDLFRRWSCYGSPALVGAVSYGLAVKPDIDMDIYGDHPRIEHGFELMSKVACLPGVWKVRFSNELSRPDQGLYWGLRYRDEAGEIWKVDAWYMVQDHPHAHWAEKLGAALEKALTPDTRGAILAIKEAMQADADVRGIDVYRAVLEGGVRTHLQFMDWIRDHQKPGLQFWLPES